MTLIEDTPLMSGYSYDYDMGENKLNVGVGIDMTMIWMRIS